MDPAGVKRLEKIRCALVRGLENVRCRSDDIG